MPVWPCPEIRARVTKLIRSSYAVTHVPPPYAYRCPFGSSSEMDCGRLAVDAVTGEIDRKGAQSVAAVLMEPNAGTNGIVAPDNYWPGLREVTRSRDVFLIADEVMSAFWPLWRMVCLATIR